MWFCETCTILTLTRQSSIMALLKFLMLSVLASFSCSSKNAYHIIFLFIFLTKKNRINYRRICNSSMPKNVIDDNDTPNSHLYLLQKSSKTRLVLYQLFRISDSPIAVTIHSTPDTSFSPHQRTQNHSCAEKKNPWWMNEQTNEATRQCDFSLCIYSPTLFTIRDQWF